jgi:hypothetical protein
MKNRTILALCGAAVGVLLTALPAQAWLVGFNTDVHNGTGQDAYDFHLKGRLGHGTSIGGTYISSVDVTPFDWGWDGVTWLPGGFEGGWSGTTPVPNCKTIHVGMWFDRDQNFMYDVVGWWTDINGNKINPLAGTPGVTPGTWYSDVPILGFGVEDATSTLTLQNATTEAVLFRNLQVAISPSIVPLANLNESLVLPWTSLTDSTLSSGSSTTFDLTSFGIPSLATLPVTSTLVIQGEVFDQTLNGGAGGYRWFDEQHQIPEPSTLLLGGIGALCLACWRNRQNRIA